MKKKNSFLRGPLLYVLILLAIFLIAQSMGGYTVSQGQTIEYSQLLEKIEAGEIGKITISANEAVALKRETSISAKDFPKKYDYYIYLPSAEQFDADVKAILGVELSLIHISFPTIFSGRKSPLSGDFYAKNLHPPGCAAASWLRWIKRLAGKSGATRCAAMPGARPSPSTQRTALPISCRGIPRARCTLSLIHIYHPHCRRKRAHRFPEAARGREWIKRARAIRNHGAAPHTPLLL